MQLNYIPRVAGKANLVRSDVLLPYKQYQNNSIDFTNNGTVESCYETS